MIAGSESRLVHACGIGIGQNGVTIVIEVLLDKPIVQDCSKECLVMWRLTRRNAIETVVSSANTILQNDCTHSNGYFSASTRPCLPPVEPPTNRDNEGLLP